MQENDIQEILDKLGNKVSLLSEENRLSKIRDDAGKELIDELGKLISSEDWIELYESIENTFVKDLMKEWGANLFPLDYKI